MQIIPLCPITGLPSRRRIQPISARLISGLWRICFGIETEGQLGGIAHFELWESPCGLAFFEPMLSGNEGFYRDLYRQLDLHRRLTTPGLARTEFQIIAKLVRPGQKILDVGCGEGGLAQCLANVSYVGLDLHFSPVAGGPNVRNETVAEHAVSQPAEYDLVCALHVIEHIADPLAFARDLVRCVRPGGRVCIAVPDRASLVTAIPNFVFNAPPHHLSWWDEGALTGIGPAPGPGNRSHRDRALLRARQHCLLDGAFCAQTDRAAILSGTLALAWRAGVELAHWPHLRCVIPGPGLGRTCGITASCA
jgi:SAM-dependent methyltransferase